MGLRQAAGGRAARGGNNKLQRGRGWIGFGPFFVIEDDDQTKKGDTRGVSNRESATLPGAWPARRHGGDEADLMIANLVAEPPGVLVLATPLVVGRVNSSYMCPPLGTAIPSHP